VSELDLSSQPEVLALFDGPVSIVVGSSSGHKKPHFARAQGIRPGERANDVVVFVPDVTAHSILSDVQENENIAVTVGDISNFETRQFVGVCTRVEQASDSDLDLCDAMLACSGETVAMFFGDEGAEAWKRMVTRPAKALHIQVLNVYDQTPGNRAGVKLL
jgi:hypothetical protein